MDYEALLEMIRTEAQQLGVEAECVQSNHEGDLVDAIQNARLSCQGIVINPGAYTHTSIAILDALKAVGLPAAEVHITDISQREAFRQVSYAGMACQAHFIGHGVKGYLEAMRWLAEQAGQTEGGR